VPAVNVRCILVIQQGIRRSLEAWLETEMRDPEVLLDPGIVRAENRATLTDSVTSQLRDLIIAGDLPPGTQLRLQSLAMRLGVSVMPIREALRVLEAERLIAAPPHRGASVLQISANEVEEIYAMRVGLERLAAKRAMERILPEEVLVLRQQFEVIAEAAKAEDLDRFSAEDRKFHRMLYAVAGRDSLYQRIVDLTQSATRAVKLAYGIWRPLMLGLDAHRPLMEAIEVGNPDRVAQLTYEHVAEGGARIHAAILRWEETEVQPFPRPRSAAISRASSSGSPSGGQSISTWTRNPIPPPLRSASPRTRQVGPSGVECPPELAEGRSRRAGGGRTPAVEKDPGLAAALDALVDPPAERAN